VSYTLYNKRNNEKLTHPKVGLWFANTIEEAQEMQDACHEYLRASHLEWMVENIIIVDAEDEDTGCVKPVGENNEK
tara:strand:+ start:23786 stop:24013 length:228 start_codon:yes stop_codon:yes gene_type:complete